MQADTAFDDKLKKIAKAIVVVGVAVMMMFFIIFVGTHAIEPGSWVAEMAKTHFAAVIGLPFIALLAFFIVIILEFSFGTIQFEGLGFKFRGASGPIVLWALCFLAITVAVRLLW
jgi:hypothetical protein